MQLRGDRPYAPLSLDHFPQESNVAIAYSAYFVSYLLCDLVLGLIYYRAYLDLLSGWLHHLGYLVVVSALTQQQHISTLFALGTPIELPTIFLAAGHIFPHLRNDILFATSFLLVRIIYPIVMLPELYLNVEARLCWKVAVMALLVHLHWFKKFVQQQKRLYRAQQITKQDALKEEQMLQQQQQLLDIQPTYMEMKRVATCSILVPHQITSSPCHDSLLASEKLLTPSAKTLSSLAYKRLESDKAMSTSGGVRGLSRASSMRDSRKRISLSSIQFEDPRKCTVPSDSNHSTSGQSTMDGEGDDTFATVVPRRRVAVSALSSRQDSQKEPAPRRHAATVFDTVRAARGISVNA
ncbi:hypothetical protein BGZ94_002384 [Podila epigama]|nr:hypothetical protein BGZ94_002384 [Podila epigama]